MDKMHGVCVPRRLSCASPGEACAPPTESSTWRGIKYLQKLVLESAGTCTCKYLKMQDPAKLSFIDRAGQLCILKLKVYNEAVKWPLE